MHGSAMPVINSTKRQIVWYGTDSEYQQVREEAARDKMSVSTWQRWIISRVIKDRQRAETNQRPAR